ncbi:uncharacterized protein KY384_004479 [Bacidia gigantensis]|uniref:uncharacterized protein n=1 Tax=Bacidia gigantensis TaxID=2732470 RepID=UPI001D04BDA8|nr:uncharacterized protein KY384_004479 [Bacidia gigantensis]KAG8531122.1 hypothetical protein KY384_004479 [Bacidia gigantensis]
MPTEPAPIVVEPSGQFLGNDGPWAAFAVDVGTPPQTLQFVPSTQQPSSWAISTNGCTDDDVANCTEARGGLYDSEKSSSWFRKDLYQLNEAANLGYGGNENNGTYGFDTVVLKGAAGDNVTMDHQVIAATGTHDFYLGVLGLNPQTVNFTNSDDSSSSLLSSLKEKDMIPSLSWGYTAGAPYQKEAGKASLTLGGHDTSRYKPNDVSFTFASTASRQLVVGLQAISYSDGTSETSLLKEGVLALIDSTVPYLWLPKSSCDAFEKAFGISWDPIRNLYLVNDTLHDNLVKANPSVTFSLANSATGGGSAANVTLPYAAFDLTAQPPLVKNNSRYFPLQRAPDDSSFTLGRTFFQEAYMVTNYEQSTFTVSQAVFDSNAPSHIVSINANNTGGNPAAPTGVTKTKSGGSNKIGTGAIAGLAIAIAIVGIIIVVVAWLCLRRRSRRRREAAHEHVEVPQEDIKETSDSTARTSYEDSPEHKKPPYSIGVNEGPMTPPNNMQEMGEEAGPSRRHELPGHPFPRSELSTPEPRSELPSPGLSNFRSELSSPEHFHKPELPTPDPSAELPSPSLRGIANPSPEPAKERPQSYRMDSSESESGFSRDGLGIGNFHKRYNSDDSRPQSYRKGSDDSIESPVLPHMSPTDTNMASPTFTDSPVSTLPARSWSGGNRPLVKRQDSDTWQTRFQEATSDESAPLSRFNTVREAKDFAQAVPMSLPSDSPKEVEKASETGEIPIVTQIDPANDVADAEKASGIEAKPDATEGPVLRKPVPIKASPDGQKRPEEEEKKME